MEKQRPVDVIDHLCRFCEIGRLAKKVMPSGKPGVWCTNCEIEAEGGSEKLCWCGHTYSQKQRSHLYRCVRNETITVENPHRVNVALNTGEIKALREGKKRAAIDDSSVDMFD
jgi:hypothetical protein